ncbi:MAG: DEAD/DEAH box helicase, partial [Candidatus Uhrbacteria bacterium]
MTETPQAPSAHTNLTGAPSDMGTQPLERWQCWLENLDTYITTHNAATKSEQTLWEEQFPVFVSLRNVIARGERSGYIELPTGSGKTVIIAEFLEAINVSGMIVVPRKEHVEQTVRKFRQFAPTLDVGRVYGRRKEFGHRLTITTYNTYVAYTKNRKFRPEEYDVVVYDEGRNVLGPEARKITEMQYSHALRIGFDATPDYAENKKLSHVLGSCIHRMTVREGIELGLLCGYRVIRVDVDTDISHVRIVGDQFDVDELDRAINMTAMLEACATIHAERFRGQRAMSFCHRIEYAERAVELFAAQHITSAAMYSKRSDCDLSAALDSFRAGTTEVLHGADWLNDGIDVPAASIGYVPAQSASSVVTIQRAGRLLRIDPDDPDKVAIIFEFVYRDARARGVTFSELVGSPTLLPKRASLEARERAEKTIRRIEERLPRIDGITVRTSLRDITEADRKRGAMRAMHLLPHIGITRPEFARRAGCSPHAAKTLLDAISAVAPQHFHMHTNGSGTTAFAAPSFVEALLARITRYPNQRDWVPLTEAAQALNRPVSVVRQSFYPDFGKFAEHITLYADGERIIEYVRASTVQLLAKQIG